MPFRIMGRFNANAGVLRRFLDVGGEVIPNSLQKPPRDNICCDCHDLIAQM